MLTPKQELLFWTGIMRDHGEFMLSSFSYNETEPIRHAAYYRDAFAGLHNRIKNLEETKEGAVPPALINECMTLLCSLINFQRTLLAGMLQCRLDSSLPPTFYNHMINEAMEFCKTLLGIRGNVMPNPVAENLEQLKVWLTDAAGHAATIACNLDPVEKCLIKEAEEFENRFNCLAKKTEELCVMLMRACLSDGALKYLNEEAYKKISEFICFLEKVKMLRSECKILGILKPLVPDHMIREENYFLSKISGFMHGFK